MTLAEEIRHAIATGDYELLEILEREAYCHRIRGYDAQPPQIDECPDLTCRCCGADNRQYVGQDDTGDPIYQCGSCGTVNPTD